MAFETADRVTLGFVGLGQMGQAAHLQNYARLANCRIAAVAEPRAQLATAVAARYGIGGVYSSAEEMLATEHLDAIVAIQPFDRHGQMLPGLYATNLPVLTEKPLAVSSIVGRRLVHQLAMTRAWHMVAYHKRCDPASIGAKEVVDGLKRTGEIGALTYVRVTMPPGDWVSGGFDDLVITDEVAVGTEPDDRPPASYVRFVNIYSHQVNLVRFLLDESFDVTFVSPSGVVLNGQSPSGVDIVLEMKPWADRFGWNESVLVCFERGWVRLDLPAPLVQHRAGRVTIHKPSITGISVADEVREYGAVHAMLEQARTFVDCVNGRTTPPTEAADALVDLEIADQYLARYENRELHTCR